MDQNIYAAMAQEIIAQQAKIIGPLAHQQARQVQGLSIDDQSLKVAIEGDGKQALEELVKQYEDFFGKAAVEVCKEAVGDLRFAVSPEMLPESLR